eukprot:416301-Hanusia_phi.AAC.1
MTICCQKHEHEARNQFRVLPPPASSSPCSPLPPPPLPPSSLQFIAPALLLVNPLPLTTTSRIPSNFLSLYFSLSHLDIDKRVMLIDEALKFLQEEEAREACK